MNEIEDFVAAAREGIRIQKALAGKTKELQELAEQAKNVQTNVEGLAWNLIRTFRDEDNSAKKDLRAVSYLFECLDLSAASDALRALQQEK